MRFRRKEGDPEAATLTLPANAKGALEFLLVFTKGS
jgi:hypothetical protein